MKKSTLVILLALCYSFTGAGFLFAAPPAKSAKKPVSKSTHSQPKQVRNKSALKVRPLLLNPSPVTYRFNEPGDLIELIPIVRDINRMIPRRFSLANHQIVLSSNRMVINHQFFDARAKASSKISTISFSYSGSVGRELSTRLEVPLFYSSLSNFGRMSAYPMGNYTMTINRDYDPVDALYIRAQTRF